MARLACACVLLALILGGCGGGTTTVTQTQTETGIQQGATNGPTAARNHGPHYFETPSHNIGCYLDSRSVRCDIRQRDWSPPPKPRYCIKAGVDWGQGVAVGAHRASIVCAGDTTLGGTGLLAYGHSARRGPIYCLSRTAGITCRNADTRHGFFLSRARYRLF